MFPTAERVVVFPHPVVAYAGSTQTTPPVGRCLCFTLYYPDTATQKVFPFLLERHQLTDIISRDPSAEIDVDY